MSEMEVIAARRAEFLAAFNREDRDTLSTIVAEDVYAMPPNRPAVTGVEEHRSWWKQLFTMGKAHLAMEPGELEVAENWAFDRFDWSMDVVTEEGARDHDEGKCLWIWRRSEDGEWQLSRSIWNSDREVGGPWAGIETKPELPFSSLG